MATTVGLAVSQGKKVFAKVLQTDTALDPSATFGQEIVEVKSVRTPPTKARPSVAFSRIVSDSPSNSHGSYYHPFVQMKWARFDVLD
jgi:hypothetical protein